MFMLSLGLHLKYVFTLHIVNEANDAAASSISGTEGDAVQWHYIEKLSNDTVPNHTLITINHQTLFLYNRTKIAGSISGAFAQKCASARRL